MIIVWHSFLIGFASMCFRMQQTPANGWLRTFSADGTYISHIYTSTAYSSFFLLLLLPLLFHSPSSPCLYHSRGRRWAKEIEGETVPSEVYSIPKPFTIAHKAAHLQSINPQLVRFSFMLWLISLLYQAKINTLYHMWMSFLISFQSNLLGHNRAQYLTQSVHYPVCQRND